MATAAASVPLREPLVWKALADPTRRHLLDVLRAGPRTTGRLAEGCEMTRFGVMKHLKVLQQAGLVLVESRGRERWHHLNPVPIREIHRRWIRTFEEEDADRLLRIKRLAEAPDMSTTTETPPIGVRTFLVEVLIEAPIERVWRAMVVDTNEWWHREFFIGPDPKALLIEPRLGGRMYEDWGDGEGMIWGHVNMVRSPELLQIVGDCSKDFGGPSRHIMTWNLEQDGGTTRLRLEHSIHGHVTAQVEENTSAGWKRLFGECFKRYVETGERTADA